MRCLICGDQDVTWVTTKMMNEDEGYAEYSCNCCKGRSEYGFKIREREYTGKDDAFPFEIE